jgi:hypothetical protein
MGFVDAASGNLHLEIPLGSFPQRGGTTVNLKLAYDSHIWTPYTTDGVTYTWAPNNVENGYLDGGWNFINPTTWRAFTPITGTFALCTFDQSFVEPNGTQHFFQVDFGSGDQNVNQPCPITTSSTYATDSSGYRLDATFIQADEYDMKLYAPNGTLVWDARQPLPRDQPSSVPALPAQRGADCQAPRTYCRPRPGPRR